MAEFDSPEIEALVERARTPLDAGSIDEEVTRVLARNDLSRRDRGNLLLARLVLLQGSLSSAEAMAHVDEAVQLLSQHADTDALVSALAIASAISAASGDRAACLKYSLEMSSVLRSNPGTEMSSRAGMNFGAALIVLGAHDLAIPLFVNSIETATDHHTGTGVVVSCTNLALAISLKLMVSGQSVATDQASLELLDRIDRAVAETKSVTSGEELDVFLAAVSAHSAQLRGDIETSAERWGHVDSLTAHTSKSFAQYLCLVEAPIAIHRGDFDRAHVLIERALEHLDVPHIVPLGRVHALKIRAALHEQTGDLAAALADSRNATSLALTETSGLADLLIGQVDTRAALEQSQRALLARADDLTEQALVDELSQVGNRRAYEVRVETLTAGPDRPIAAVLLDIDCFKAINDQHGHQVGDDVISRVGPLIAQHVGDLNRVFRYGGDEFIALPPSATVEQANEVAERIRTAFMAECWAVDGQPISITCSIGVWGGTTKDLVDGIAEADELLYQAKRAGRNQVRAFTPAVPD